MEFNLGYLETGALRAAGARPVRGYWPHLRLIPLIESAELQQQAAGLPAHTRAVVGLPLPKRPVPVHAIVTTDPARSRQLVTAEGAPPIIGWDGVDAAYQEWMRSTYLPFERQVALFEPQGLRPVDTPAESAHLEVVGSCGSGFMLRYTDGVAQQLNMQLQCSHIVHNHPVPVGRVGARPDFQVVVPPLRYMHPRNLDDFFAWTDHELGLRETIAHMRRYMDSIAAGLDVDHRFVVGFLEPFSDPLGYDTAAGGPENFKVFVRRANEALAAWCRTRPGTHFVDGNEISALLGRMRTDEEMLNYYGHRIVFDPYDDWIEQDNPLTPYSTLESFDMQPALYYTVLLRHVLARRTTILGRAPVKLVITDLDNTLWRGVAAEGTVDHWNSRPAGYAEALRIVQRRGILLAIASKNDDDFVRSRWDALKGAGEDPLGISLALSDFVMARINFGPKSESVRQILAATNLAAANTVFIDDNPLEREEVQAAFPEMRVLGAELSYLRRELLYSPYTQRAVLTDEDRHRTEMTLSRIAFHEAGGDDGAGGDFLAQLGLTLRTGVAADATSDEAVRAVQLIDKTNQWNLNGRRIEGPLPAGHQLVWGSVADSHSGYGIVAAAVVDPTEAAVTHLVVSCRVIGMGIDEAFVAELGRAFGRLRLAYAATDRNRATQAFMAARHGLLDLDGAAGPAHVAIEAPLAVLAGS
ncbi:MAG TPA: HAD-IIIC family phosphatase [Acidimicrobiales bacterium]|jgi:FkbH-like protein|nr:HAD-IIIC family phosphatase [Acidimicrobiales bacterium]